MNVLITGANGLLGQKLVDLLANKDYIDLLATSRGASKFENDMVEYEYATMDITSPSEIMDVFDDFEPEIVINTAAMTGVDQCESDRENCDKINVEGVKNLKEACIEHESFLIQLSTDFVFDGKNGPYSENDKPNPVNYYGQSKLKAEELLLKDKNGAGLSFAIVRTVLVYGFAPYMSKNNIVLWVRESLEQGKSIQVVDDQWRTPTLAEDLAIGCSLIAEKQFKGIFHISGPEMLTPFQIATKTADHFDLDKSLITRTNSEKFKQDARRPPKTGFNITKARDMLGYDPHSFEEGLEVVNSQVFRFY